MKKIIAPEIQREVAIGSVIPTTRYVSFWATPDALPDFEQFGDLREQEDCKDKYGLIVDGRYDFDEVVAYVVAIAGAER